MKKHAFETRAASLLASRTMQDLCDMFAQTETIPYTQQVADVRGAIMEELERRDPASFSVWINDGYDEMPSKYFISGAPA